MCAWQVLSVDFGGKQWVDVSHLRWLPVGLSSIPPFAVCCRLANVEPTSVGDAAAEWTPEAIDVLTHTMNGKLLTAWLHESLPPGAFVRYVGHMQWHRLHGARGRGGMCPPLLQMGGPRGAP